MKLSPLTVAVIALLALGPATAAEKKDAEKKDAEKWSVESTQGACWRRIFRKTLAVE